jgi:hypothetical protein
MSDGEEEKEVADGGGEGGKLNSVYTNFLHGMAGTALKFAELMSSMKAANDEREVVYKDLDSYLKELVGQSWFVSYSLSFRSFEELSFFALVAPEDKVEREGFIDRLFSERYTECFEYLCQRATQLFPNRAFAIEPAAKAHLNGDYALSIPVFLSQAEGIVRELTNTELFSKTSKRFTNVADYASSKHAEVTNLTQWMDYADAAFWSQFKDPLPIALNQTDRGDGFSGLNRNLVLHGIDLAYNTQLNSLKAFSLLSYSASLYEAQLMEADDD